MSSYDHIIVGCGSAGSVIAHHLVKAGKKVCVLEAGPADRNLFIHVPVGFVKTLHNPKLTYQYHTEGTEWTGKRDVFIPQGKTLGGSSSVNGMVFVRGQAQDYDHWAQMGNRGWGYRDVLPYLKRIENRQAPHDGAYRSTSGAIPVTDPDWRHPLCNAFIAGAVENGIPLNPDYNGAEQWGTGYYQRAIQRQIRRSAYRSYLHPLRKAPNLTLLTDTMVEKVLFEGKRATGVRYRGADGTRHDITAGEVILCSGGLNTPKLLQLSGVGPADLLRGHGIEVIHDLPGVGENLSDHYSPRIVARARNTRSINNQVKGLRLLGEVTRWAAGAPSVLGLSAAVCYAFGKSRPELESPDFTLIFTPASYKGGHLGVLDDYAGMTCGAWQMRPESTGYVRIRSNRIEDAPIIQPNYLSTDNDRKTLLHALRTARKVLGSEALSQYYDAEILPGKDVQSDDELLDFARQYGNSTYHMAGACRMGPRDAQNTVVDDQLRVHGLTGLRIADSSVLPAMTSANTYVSALLVGEKAADFLLGRQEAIAA